jgi:hypothetical protein
LAHASPQTANTTGQFPAEQAAYLIIFLALFSSFSMGAFMASDFDAPFNLCPLN